MNRSVLNYAAALVIPIALVLIGARLTSGATRSQIAPVSAPIAGVDLAAAPAEDTAVFAGGCFWGVEAVFDHVKGVKRAISGYAGGQLANPSYEQVSTGTTGHAESVEVIYDPSQVSYGKLLQIFFSVAHDPTELNRQGPDHGPQYRSAIFYRTAQQQQVAESYIKQLTAAKTFSRPIVTQVAKLGGFYAAEDYHQNYLANHPNQLYIVINDKPKLVALKRQFGDIYRD
ncbi:MAG: peptide-methionine (S)-S-oxide reductase [Gemmatimonadetes bacterium]|nr:MAG: peptide-methionine (S)-S-oxide reductase [Gemmatimonadota bacterium]PYO80643.1 MAG: peptide-methionine (S)-S-oxide reductase [Gemmatimonadota bacterium]